jgi:hypothetical protein
VNKQSPPDCSIAIRSAGRVPGGMRSSSLPIWRNDPADLTSHTSVHHLVVFLPSPHPPPPWTEFSNPAPPHHHPSRSFPLDPLAPSILSSPMVSPSSSRTAPAPLSPQPIELTISHHSPNHLPPFPTGPFLPPLPSNIPHSLYPSL